MPPRLLRAHLLLPAQLLPPGLLRVPPLPPRVPPCLLCAHLLLPAQLLPPGLLCVPALPARMLPPSLLRPCLGPEALLLSVPLKVTPKCESSQSSATVDSLLIA